MKMLRPSLFLLVIVVCLPACRGKRPEFTADGRVLVEFWHAMGGPLGEVLETMVGEFNQQHPDIHVESISMGNYDTLQKKILASVVAGESPDISQNFEALTLRMARAGKLVQLESLLADESGGIARLKADIIPVLLKNNTYDGKLWSFPFNKSVPVLYYNKDLFRAAGLDPGHPPETIDEMHDYARQLTTDRDGDGVPEVYGYAFNQANSWLFECRLLQCGGELIAPDHRSVSYDNDAGARALDFNLRFLREKTGYAAQGFDHQNDFISQRVAMIEGSIVSRVYMERKLTFDFGVAPIACDRRKAVVISGTNINVFDNGSPRKVAAAVEFIKWFTGTDQGVTWSLGTTYVPVRRSSLTAPRMLAAFQKDPSLRSPYAQLDYATFEPRLQAWYYCRDTLTDALDQAFIERGDPRRYLARATREINDILQSAEE
ncbi:ABC transporter substrate-binding protein [bacterium]|nr:ABC transporter substrate-binding protein [candidate division CSSED10-310 bacterium]